MRMSKKETTAMLLNSPNFKGSRSEGGFTWRLFGLTVKPVQVLSQKYLPFCSNVAFYSFKPGPHHRCSFKPPSELLLTHT